MAVTRLASLQPEGERRVKSSYQSCQGSRGSGPSMGSAGGAGAPFGALGFPLRWGAETVTNPGWDERLVITGP